MIHDKIMNKVQKESYYLLQGDIEYPKGNEWYSGKSDMLKDINIISLDKLSEIIHEEDFEEWDMMMENIARNTLLFFLRDIQKHPKIYNDTKFFEVIDKIQEVFKRENIAR